VTRLPIITAGGAVVVEIVICPNCDDTKNG
jgi:hypothetical protein